MTQKEMILDYMRNHGGISQSEAFLQLGCSRLSGRIYDLRADGHTIFTDMVKGKNRYGEPTEYAVYRLIER